MENFVQELIDTKQSELETITDLVINTIKAKALFNKGGWTLVNKELGNRYMNPNFAMHVRTIINLLSELNIKTTISIQNNMGEIERMVNKKLGVKAVRYEVDRLAHYLRIVI